MHDKGCQLDFPNCLCNTCAKDCYECCFEYAPLCPVEKTCPDYTPEDTLGNDVMSMVNTHAAESQEGDANPQALLDEPQPARCSIPTRLHMKLFDVGLGSFAGCAVVLALLEFFRYYRQSTPLWAYRYLAALEVFALTVMGLLIIAAALWRDTIPCKDGFFVRAAGKAQGLRERLEAEQKQAEQK